MKKYLVILGYGLKNNTTFEFDLELLAKEKYNELARWFGYENVGLIEVEK
jgi:hypothetical protein